MNWIKRTLTKHDLSLAKRSLDSLAIKYGVVNSSGEPVPKEIAARNGVPWTTSAINAWVSRVGGRQATPGNWTLTVGNQILLPEKAVVPDPSERGGTPVLASQTLWGIVPWWAWPVVIATPLIIYRRRKAKKAGKKPKPILFS